MRVALAFLALIIPSALGAQEGVVDRRPANESGKTLTMTEAVLGTGVRPKSVHASWEDNNSIRFHDGEGWRLQDALTGEVSDFPRTMLPAGFPKEARNVVPSGGGAYAFTIGRSLFVYTDSVRCVAASDDTDITYGQTVSRNEFGIDGGIFWSPDGSKLSFYRKDESLVSEFPLLDISTRTGSLVSIKYPMNGMDSERISLGVFDLTTGRTSYCDAADFGPDQYLTNVSWSPDSRNIFIQVLDREQRHMRLNMYRSSDGSFVRTILTEENARFVEPQDPLHFIKGTCSFIYRTDNRDGFKNLYLCDTLGTVRRLTAVDADVEYIGNDGEHLFYTSAEVAPTENHLYKIALKLDKKSPVEKARFGKPVRLTVEEGWHDVSLSPDCSRFIDSYSSYNVPGVTVLRSSDGKLVRALCESVDPLAEYKTGEMLFGTVKSADGKYDNAYRLFLPAGFDPGKKYPVVLYVYGGPHSQMVRNSWLGQVRMWEVLMAQKGYVVYVQDNRGTQNHGAEYEKAIHGQCGQNEMADQMVGIEMLKKLPFVDSDRIGVHGWSYGGFMTISLMTTHPETFKVGVAGGPVIDWKWYEVMYGERYMGTEAENPDGFAKTSLVGKAGDLNGKLLICQGAVDNTVVWQHSLNFVQSCIENGVQLDYFPYPLSEHNVFGEWRVHLMQKVTDYFDRNL